jgi:hypothetical protein
LSAVSVSLCKIAATESETDNIQVSPKNLISLTERLSKIRRGDEHIWKKSSVFSKLSKGIFFVNLEPLTETAELLRFLRGFFCQSGNLTEANAVLERE